jgi:hypothetical protein
MADSTLSTMDAVAALMQEREKYEGWLSALDGRRAATPPRVYERVSADYRARLDHVLADIAGRASELEAVSTGLRTRVQALEADEESRMEERAEAEVRAAVGEYSPEQWEELRGVADAEIAHVSAQLASQRAELDRVEGILTIARGPRPDAARAAQPAVAAPAVVAPAAEAPSSWAPPRDVTREVGRDTPREPARDSTRDPPREPSRWAADAPAAQPPARVAEQRPAARGEIAATPEASVIIPFTVEGEGPASGTRDLEGASRRPAGDQPWSDQSGNDAAFDDLAFLKSIVEPTVGGGPTSAGAASGAPPAASASTGGGRPPARTDESRLSTPGRGLAALRSLLGNDDKSSATGSGGAARSAAGAGGREEQRASASARDDGGTGGGTSGTSGGGTKTLRCGECGTLNYPTEWYCERCGGELAAM